MFLIDLYSWHRSPSSDTRSPRLQGLFLPLSSLQTLIYYRMNNQYKKKDLSKIIYFLNFNFLFKNYEIKNHLKFHKF